MESKLFHHGELSKSWLLFPTRAIVRLSNFAELELLRRLQIVYLMLYSRDDQRANSHLEESRYR